jgi:hypothetical protein
LIDLVLGLVNYIFKDEVLERLGVQKSQIAFSVASLIFPKQMLREYGCLPEKKSQILSIYHYLYKFSLERL